MNQLRILLPALFFAVWACAVGIMHFRLAGPQSAHYLEAGKRIAMVRGEYFPPRARLLDEKQTPLAWSERYFDLIWRESAAPPAKLLRSLSEQLAMKLEPEKDLSGKNWLLRRDLSPDELLKTAPVLRRHPALFIRSRLERIAVNIPEVRSRIGRTKLVNGELQGISGWEKEFDHLLRGIPGSYEVMLDRRRQWIDSTWKLNTPAIPGQDVQVPFRLEGGR